MLKYLVLGMVAVVLAAACGEDNKDSSAGSSSPTAAAASTSSPGATTSPAAKPTVSPVAVTSPTAAASPTKPPSTSDLSGTWKGTWANTNVTGAGTFTIVWNQSGDTLTGTINVVGTPCLSAGTVSGKVTGSAIQFGAVQGLVRIDYTGTIAASGLKGTYKAGADCASAEGNWEAVR